MNLQASMISWPLSALRFMAVGAVTVLLLAAALIMRPFTSRPPPWAAVLACRVFLALMGVKLTVHGRVPEGGPYLVAANHSSWLDILIVGFIVKGEFVAKSEIARWPLVRHLARSFRTMFIDREALLKAGEQAEVMAGRLRDGDNVIFFPEGHCGDGNRVQRFKTSLFAASDAKTADGAAVKILPVTVAYTHLDGLPLGRMFRPLYAFYGDVGFFHHSRTVMGLGCAQAQIVIHEPLAPADFASRKQLAQHCREVIEGSFNRCLRGQLLPRGTPAARWEALQQRARG